MKLVRHGDDLHLLPQFAFYPVVTFYSFFLSSKSVTDGLTADAAPPLLRKIVNHLSFTDNELRTIPIAEKVSLKKTHLYNKKVDEGLVLFVSLSFYSSFLLVLLFHKRVGPLL